MRAVRLLLLVKTLLLLDKVSGAIFNLIGTDKSISDTPIHSIEGAPYQKCFSFCHHSTKCFSFEVSRSSTFTGCQFYQQIYNESMTLDNKPGVTYYSTNAAKDCAEWYRQGKHTSGVYEVNLLGIYNKKVFCNMELAGGGWLVFQKRFDGSVDFFGKEWEAFREGFGEVHGEHWLGNKWLNLLTTSEKHDYLVWAKDFDGEVRMKKMLGVKVEDEGQGYRITFEQETHDLLPDQAYGYMSGSKFSTAQVENHLHSYENCGALYGAWWHNACHQEAMNGEYSSTRSPVSANGIIWNGWKTLSETLQASLIMIRPRSFNP